MIKSDFKNKLNMLGEDLSRYKFCVALSGGIDSIGLLSLLISEVPKQNIYALTIDHKLRHASSQEAQEVSNYCREIGVSHEILVWDHCEISSGIQENAREARYELLTNWCLDNKIDYLLTAHHLNDQLEQILISLSQGAGIYSFCIKELTDYNNVKIFRPLLEIKKTDIENYVAQNKIPFWQDDSNFSDKYLRNRIREYTNGLLEEMNVQRFLTSCENLQRASNSISNISNNFLKNYAEFSNLGYCKLSKEKFLKQEEEIKLLVLRNILGNIGKRNSEIRLESLKILLQNIKTNKISTLCGCYIEIYKDHIIFIRELGRDKNFIYDIEKNLWDGRFEIKFPKNYNIKTLQSKDLAIEGLKLDFDDFLSTKLRKKIILTLPGICILEKLVTIPHIYNYEKNNFVEFEFKKIKLK